MRHAVEAGIRGVPTLISMGIKLLLRENISAMLEDYPTSAMRSCMGTRSGMKGHYFTRKRDHVGACNGGNKSSMKGQLLLNRVTIGLQGDRVAHDWKEAIEAPRSGLLGRWFDIDVSSYFGAPDPRTRQAAEKEASGG